MRDLLSNRYAQDGDWVDDLVKAVFEKLLLRPADLPSLQAWSTELRSGRATVAGFLQTVLGSEEFGLHRLEFNAVYPSHHAGRFTNDVSQFGEVDLLVRELVNHAAKFRIIVDVGARGRARSNSFDLLRCCRWRGLLIEANPNLLAEINRDFAGTEFSLVNCAVSDYTGKAKFHLGVNNDVSSLVLQHASAWGEIQGDIEVNVERLGNVLAAHKIPYDFDVLSLDIEGEDIRVFNNVVGDGYTPAWVIIEASYDFQTKSLNDLQLRPDIVNRYQIIGQTCANLLLKRN